MTLRRALAALLLFTAACGQQAGDEVAPEAPAETTPAVAASPAGGAVLEQAIAFEDPNWCVPSPEFLALLDAMTPRDEAGHPAEPFRPVVPAALRGMAGEPKLSSEDTVHRVVLDMSGTWHGLALRSVTRIWGEESDYQWLTLQFDNSADEVIAAFNALGFALPASGSRVMPGELEGHIYVEANELGASFSCGT